MTKTPSRRSILLLAALSAVGATELVAQAPVTSGERVRVTWDDGGWSSHGFRTVRSLTFDLVRVDGERIVGRHGSTTVTVPRASVLKFERRIGTKPATAPEMVIGSAGGFLAGFIGGVFKASLDPTVNGAADVIDSGVVTGVLFGAPLGAIVAWGISRSRGLYEPIELGGVRTRLDVSPSAAGLRVSVPVR